MSRPGLLHRIGAWLEDVASGGKLDDVVPPAPPPRPRVVEIVDRAQLVRLLTATREQGGIDGRRVLDVQFTHDKITLVFASEEAERLRAKEAADHAAWLRENAASVVLPEHPAVPWLRRIPWVGVCPACGRGVNEGHADDCEIAAILAGRKPGERALADLLAEEREAGKREGLKMRDENAQNLVDNLREQHAREVDEARELGRQEQREQHARNLRALEAESQQVLGARLAEERAKGAAEEREAVCRWMTAEWGTQEDAETNRLIGEVVQDIRDGKHVTPAKPMPIGWTAADEREAIATLLERWPGHEPVAFWRAVEVIRARGQS